MSICDAIVACGGDALYQFEAIDEPLLDHAALEVGGDGAIRPAGSREVVGQVADVMTGRVFGLYADGSADIKAALGADHIVGIDRDDAVEQYAGNSRQVGNGVTRLGLVTHRVPLFELFGKAGGGPACATLYLRKNLSLPESHPSRYSVTRAAAQARRERIPEVLRVDPGYFGDKPRG